jgi:hypothetical protein
MSSKSVDANYSVPQTSIPAAVSCSWTDDSTLGLTARFIDESLGDQTIKCKFSEFNGIVRITIEQSTPSFMTRGQGRAPRVQLRGTMVDIK